MEHDQPVPGALCSEGSWRAEAPDGSNPDTEGRAYGMTDTAPTQTIRLSWAEIAGLTVGAVCVWRTGLMSAFPSALGLSILAASDFKTRRVPRETFMRAAVATFGFGVLDAASQADDSRLVEALLTTAIVTLISGAIWAATSGIAFGDVKLIALATFVPAWMRGTAVVVMMLVALFAAVVMVVVERFRAGPVTMKSSIAFGPPLLVGWLVGVLTA
jgi:Type IV leader peptidase family